MSQKFLPRSIPKSMHTITSTWMFITTLFFITPKWKPPVYLSTDKMMNNMCYIISHNGLFFRNIKKWIVATCNIDESWKHYFKWKKPATKHHILSNSSCMNWSIWWHLCTSSILLLCWITWETLNPYLFPLVKLPLFSEYYTSKTVMVAIEKRILEE